MINLPHDPRRATFDAQAETMAVEVAGCELDDARHLVAVQVGFSGWAALQTYLDVADVYRRENDPHIETETIPDEFCRLACLTYTDDPPERRAAARELLGAHPDLTVDHIWAAAAAADTDAIRTLLAMNPSLANQEGGPYAWTPLYYLAYSRHDPAIREETVIMAARLLLRAGADANAGYLYGGMPTPFTVLTGVFGEGEQGPGRCPRHPHADAFAQLLLTAGADPNDGQTLYNRMFSADDSHLELLFAHGLGIDNDGPWSDRLGEAAETPQDLIDGQLGWAIKHGYANRVELLIIHGADVTRPLSDGRLPAVVAAGNGDRRLVEILVEAGAVRPEMTGLPAFIAGCLAGDADAVLAEPQLLAEALATHPQLIARAVDAGRVDAVPLLAKLGFDVNAGTDGETPLHWAAWYGNVAAARVLLEAGADPDATDRTFAATPLDWAEHSCQAEFIAFIAPLTEAKA